MNITIQKNGAVVSIENLEPLTGKSEKKRLKGLRKTLKTIGEPLEGSSIYPRKEGPVTVLAPGVAVSSDGTAITYDGNIYFRPKEPEGTPDAPTRVVGFQPEPVND